MKGLFVPGWAATAGLYAAGLPEGWEVLGPPSFRTSRGELSAYRRWLGAEIARRRTPVALAGHSMGGALALLAAADQPDLVEKLILLSPAGLPLNKPLRASTATFVGQVARRRYPIGELRPRAHPHGNRAAGRATSGAKRARPGPHAGTRADPQASHSLHGNWMRQRRADHPRALPPTRNSSQRKLPRTGRLGRTHLDDHRTPTARQRTDTLSLRLITGRRSPARASAYRVTGCCSGNPASARATSSVESIPTGRAE